jgi:DNA polymerase III alpha subunit
VHFTPIDVQLSDWACRVDEDGTIRLGLMYVNGLREAVGRAIAGVRPPSIESQVRRPDRCPKCGCDDQAMLEAMLRPGAAAPHAAPVVECFCNICAHDWRVTMAVPQRFTSIEDVIRRTGVRRDELSVLAEIGALNGLGYDRRAALWQIERAVRPGGALFEEEEAAAGGRRAVAEEDGAQTPSPLAPMSTVERLTADYAGTSLTIGPHPMALQRVALATRGVRRAVDLPRGLNGQRVRTAGMVITRQRPGTAKGFVFLTLEDETGVANIIVRPDLFAAERDTVVTAPCLFVEGILQNIDGVTSIKAERMEPIGGLPAGESHDFY